MSHFTGKKLTIISEKRRNEREAIVFSRFISKLSDYQSETCEVFIQEEARQIIVAVHYPQKVSIFITEFKYRVKFDNFPLKMR